MVVDGTTVPIHGQQLTWLLHFAQFGGVTHSLRQSNKQAIVLIKLASDMYMKNRLCLFFIHILLNVTDRMQIKPCCSTS